MTSDQSPRATARELSQESKEALSTRLRLLCGDSISQRALADRSGVSYGAVGDLWHARSDPTLSTLLRIVDALGLSSIEELLAPIGTQVLLDHERTALERREQPA